MTSASSRRASRATDLLHQRLQHFPHYYATTCTIRPDPPTIIVFVNQPDDPLTSAVPPTWYGFRVELQTTDRIRPRSNASQVPVHKNLETDLEAEILGGFNGWTEVAPAQEGDYLITTPFWNHVGDPVLVGVRTTEHGYHVTDAGAIAGQLFSIGQHTDETPGYRLLMKLGQAHDLTIDHDNRELYLECDHDSLYETVAEITKVILTMLPAAAHLPAGP